MDESISLSEINQGLGSIIGAKNICLLIQIDCFVRSIHRTMPFIAISYSSGKGDVGVLLHQLEMFASYALILETLLVIRSDESDEKLNVRFSKSIDLLNAMNSILHQ